MSNQGVINITNEMRDQFIDDCIAGTRRRDSEYTVPNREIWNAYREWLHIFAGRSDRDISTTEARYLYDRIQIKWHGIIVEDRTRSQHVGMILLPMPQ